MEDLRSSRLLRLAVLLHVCIAVQVAVMTAVSTSTDERRECDARVASATVMATVCTHASGDHKMLDLLVLWCGAPGWFQRSEKGGHATEVVRDFAHGERGRVAQFRTYANVTVGFDADFDAHTVAIDSLIVPVSSNTIVVDDVDVPHIRRITKTFRVDPTLPDRDDAVLIVARRSADVRTALQCDVQTRPPAPGPGWPVPHQSRAATVCELLRR
jgi:hypothetical protein